MRYQADLLLPAVHTNAHPGISRAEKDVQVCAEAARDPGVGMKHTSSAEGVNVMGGIAACDGGLLAGADACRAASGVTEGAPGPAGGGDLPVDVAAGQEIKATSSQGRICFQLAYNVANCNLLSGLISLPSQHTLTYLVWLVAVMPAAVPQLQ